MGNGTMIGQNTTCSESGHNCPELRFNYHNERREYSNRKIVLSRHIAPKYGEFVDLTGTISFNEDELSPSNAYYTLLISGPGNQSYSSML